MQLLERLGKFRLKMNWSENHIFHYLLNLLNHQNLNMDTNHLERALRVIPMGRKNYLFCWSELGAEQLGILQSLMVTCRLQGVNPYHYLVDVLQRVALHPARDVIDLTPRLWKQKYNQNRLVSDVKILTSQH